jgi:Flp pilus assembly protein TadD
MIFRELGDREGQTCALNGLGEAANTAGRPTDALTHHTTALSVATDIGVANQQARAHTGLGQAYDRLANPSQARHHHERALSLYIDLESPEADQLRVRLGALTRD